MAMKVSVVVPTFGRASLLADTLRSVEAQSHQPSEVIVVDDCSPDPISVPHARVVRHARNLGAGAARNTGLAHATGDLVLFLDDDDLLSHDRLEFAVSEIGDSRAHAMAVENLYPDGRREPYGAPFAGDLRSTFSRRMHPAIGQVVFRREDIEQFTPWMPVGQDKEWWLRMGHAADFVWNPAVGLTVRRHDGDRPWASSALRSDMSNLIYELHAAGLDRRSRARLAREVASSAVFAGRRRVGASYALRSLAAQPTTLGLKLLARSAFPGDSRQ
jgi:glycosyltransferase involved in cell wall biosynthesis